MTSMRKHRICHCGKQARKAGLCLPCYNRQHYERTRAKAPGSGEPVRVAGWGYLGERHR